VESRAGRPGGGDRAGDHLLPLPARHQPGTSKWNKIEHRLFSAITMNWRGRPLTSHQVIVNSIAATTTSTGLRVHAELDPASYPAKIKISDAQMDSLPLHRHGWHGDWNYTLHPAPPAPPLPPPPPARQPERAHWAHPALTGLTDNGWNQLITLLTSPARHPHRGHPPALTLAEQALATVLRQRFATPQPVLAELFGVVTGTIAKAQRHTTPLLRQNSVT